MRRRSQLEPAVLSTRFVLCTGVVLRDGRDAPAAVSERPGRTLTGIRNGLQRCFFRSLQAPSEVAANTNTSWLGPLNYLRHCVRAIPNLL